MSVVGASIPKSSFLAEDRDTAALVIFALTVILQFVSEPSGFGVVKIMRVGQTDEQVGVVILLRAVVARVTAFDASVRDDEAALRIGCDGDGTHQALAVACAVTGLYVGVQRA